MSDRLAVFNQGRIEQLGTPVEVYERPGQRVRRGLHRRVQPRSNAADAISRSAQRRSTCWPTARQRRRAATSSAAGSSDVVYLGMLTRYQVALEAGGTLTAVRQNLETAAAEALEARGGP